VPQAIIGCRYIFTCVLYYFRFWLSGAWLCATYIPGLSGLVRVRNLGGRLGQLDHAKQGWEVDVPIHGLKLVKIVIRIRWMVWVLNPA